MAGGNRQGDMRQLVRGVFRQQAKGAFLTLNLLRQHWPNVVGPELGARTHPQRLDGGTLWIAAPDACWAYELQFFKPELLSSVQAFLESRAVSDLRFQVGAVPAQPAEAPAAEAPRPALGPAPGLATPAAAAARARATAARLAAPAAPPALARAATAIGDPALRAVFQRSLAQQRQNHQRRSREPQPAGAQSGAQGAAPPDATAPRGDEER